MNRRLEVLPEAKWDGLQKYNLILCIVHAILAIVFIVYFRSVLDPNKPVKSINLDLYDHIFASDMSDPNAPLQVVSVVAGTTPHEVGIVGKR